MQEKTDSERKAQEMISEMRQSGALPAMSKNVRDLSLLGHDENAGAADIAAIIMRDEGLCTLVLSTINSALYSLKYPVLSISTAVRFLGFENVHSLAMSLSLLKNVLSNSDEEALFEVYTHAYLAGSFSMALAKDMRSSNPEENFVAGMFYHLPMTALRVCFPQEYKKIEERCHQGMNFEKAFKEVKEVQYKDFCKELIAYYSIRGSAAKLLTTSRQGLLPLERLSVCADHIAQHLSLMQVGTERLSSFSKIETELEGLLKKKFSCVDFIAEQLEKDPNMSSFFHLSADKVQAVIADLRTTGKSRQSLSSRSLGRDVLNRSNLRESEEQASSNISTKKEQSKRELMGSFVTEFLMAKSKDVPIGDVLMMIQEGVYRCIAGSEVVLFLLNRKERRYLGKYYSSQESSFEAKDFFVAQVQRQSKLIQAMSKKQKLSLSEGFSELGLPRKILLEKKIKAALVEPIVVKEKTLGMYFVFRCNDEAFSEEESLWLGQFAQYVSEIISERGEHLL